MEWADKNNKNEKDWNDLKKTNRYLQQIINNSKDMIITTDKNGLIVQFNREAEEKLGYKKEQAINSQVSILWQNPAEREKIMELVWEDGVVRNKDIALLSKDGKPVYVSLTLSLLENDVGSVVGTVGICRDISEKSMLRQKLVQSEKMAGLGTLASGIAHEINNPLAGVLGMAEAIRDENDLEKIKSFSKDIIDYTLEASAIVKELSDYSRIAINEAISTIDLSELIENSFKIIRHSNDFSKISFETDLQKDCWISANSGEIQQIFTNLITNSIDAMEDKGGELVLKCSRDNKIIKAVVSDTGIGIKKEHLNRIYDPFFTTKLPGKGTGLGLFVIYKIISKYKGNIDVVSEEGKGTSVFLTFPLLPSFLKTQDK